MLSSSAWFLDFNIHNSMFGVMMDMIYEWTLNSKHAKHTLCNITITTCLVDSGKSSQKSE